MKHPQIAWLKSSPFILMHFSVLAVFFVPWSWKLALLCLGSYYLRMFAITAGYHRYFSHRSYKMRRIPQFLMALLGCTALQKGPLWWAAHHRYHHRHSDQPKDIHSPVQQGFWWSHVGWILSTEHDETRESLIPDLLKHPELRWLNQFHVLPGIVYASLFYFVGGWPALIWGFVVSTVILWHGTFTINSLSHVFGRIRYVTPDTSKNNFWLALITLGEGWHNNHHCYMSSANQGFFWWEIDGSYYILKGLSYLRIVNDLRKAPLKLLETKRVKSGLHTRIANPLDVDKVQSLGRA